MEEEKFKERLTRFYKVYNPSCISSVDTISKTYRGREEDIFRVLIDKYGPEPLIDKENKEESEVNLETSKIFSSIDDWPTRFYNFFSYYQPEKISELPQELANHKDQELEWMSNLVKKYGKEPNRDEINNNSKNKKIVILKDRLINFYNLHNKAMIPFVDELIKNYNGNEEEIFRDLDYQYITPKKDVTKNISSSFTNFNDVIKRLSNALEVKTTEALTLKNEKEVLIKDLSNANKLIDDFKNKEILLKTKLLAVEEKLKEKSISAALEIKNTEILTLKNDKEQVIKELDKAIKLVNELQIKEKVLKKQLFITEEQLRSKETFIPSRNYSNDYDTENSLNSELKMMKKKHSEIRTLHNKLEHRIRVLEVEKEQLLEELKQAEKRTFEVSDLLSIEHRRNLSLLEEVGRLKLAVERPSSEEAFTAIIKEIEKRLSEHYETELEQHRKEMNEYYLYAENQLRRRDALIAELGIDHQ